MPGVKNAAVRKLDHELGISAEHVPVDSFKFLTRVHYYAADAVTHGPNAPWGEHEIDYILFIQVNMLRRIQQSYLGTIENDFLGISAAAEILPLLMAFTEH